MAAHLEVLCRGCSRPRGEHGVSSAARRSFWSGICSESPHHGQGTGERGPNPCAPVSRPRCGPQQKPCPQPRGRSKEPQGPGSASHWSLSPLKSQPKQQGHNQQVAPTPGQAGPGALPSKAAPHPGPSGPPGVPSSERAHRSGTAGCQVTGSRRGPLTSTASSTRLRSLCLRSRGFRSRSFCGTPGVARTR